MNRKQKFLAWGLLILVGLALYLPSLSVPYIYDDYLHFVDNPRLQEASTLSDVFFNGRQETRPVFNLSLFLQSYFFGMDAVAAHAGNVFIFFLCVAGLIFFLKALSLPPKAVWITAFLFLVHPINVESVAYFNSRSGLLALTFALWAQPFLLKPKWRSFWVGMFFLILAMGSKEDGVVGVLLALWTQLFLHWKEKRKPCPWRLASMIASLLVLPLIYAVFRSPHLNTVGADVAPWNVYVLEQGRNLVLHLSTFFIPYPLTFDRDLSSWMNSWEVLMGCWLILAFFVHMAWRFRHSWISFGFVWALLALLPTHSFVPVLDVHASRILFPMVPALALATHFVLVKYLGEIRKAYVVALSILLIGFSSLTFHNIQVWQEPLRVWERNARQAPSRWRTWVNLAVECGESGKWRKAHKAILQARRLAPERPEVLYNQAVIYAVRKDAQRNLKLAKHFLLEALKRDPHHKRAQQLLKRISP